MSFAHLSSTLLLMSLLLLSSCGDSPNASLEGYYQGISTDDEVVDVIHLKKLDDQSEGAEVVYRITNISNKKNTLTLNKETIQLDMHMIFPSKDAQSGKVTVGNYAHILDKIDSSSLKAAMREKAAEALNEASSRLEEVEIEVVGGKINAQVPGKIETLIVYSRLEDKNAANAAAAKIMVAEGQLLQGKEYTFVGSLTDPQFSVEVEESKPLTFVTLNLKRDGNNLLGGISVPSKGWSGDVQGVLKDGRVQQLMITIRNKDELSTPITLYLQGSGSLEDGVLSAELHSLGNLADHGTLLLSVIKN